MTALRLPGPLAQVALVGVVVAGVAGAVEARGWVIGGAPGLWWQIATGLGLLAIYLHQWRIFVDRMTHRTAGSEGRVSRHRILGVGMLGVFVLHAGSIGYGLSGALTILLLANGVVGALSRRDGCLRTRQQILTWTGVHVALGAILAPLIALHVWVALAFE